MPAPTPSGSRGAGSMPGAAAAAVASPERWRRKKAVISDRRADAVRRLAEPVALVGEEHVLDGHAAPLQSVATTCSASTTGTLVSLAPWSTRSGSGCGRAGGSARGAGAARAWVVGSPYSTVEMAAIHGSVSREEGLEVHDAEQVHAGGEELGELGQARPSPCSRRTSRPSRPSRFGSATPDFDHPVDAVLEVLHGLHPQRTVVEVDEALAEARPSRGRSARTREMPCASSTW